MTITTHAAIGAAIGAGLGNPTVGFVLGMASHFLVDMIPHGDTKIMVGYHSGGKRKTGAAYVLVDAIIALCLLLFFFNKAVYIDKFTFTMAIAGSILPDAIVGLYEVTKKKWLKPFVRLHFFFHNFFSQTYGDIKLSYALMAQLVVILILSHWVVF